MKKIILMFALYLSGMAAMAQSTRTIKGAVVDKDGNPLPGATVEATNGAESTVVDADGTFTLEVPRWLNTATAKYAGMYNKKMKVQAGDMIFRMTPKKERVWMVNAIGGYGMGGALDGGFTFGAMGANLGNWGGYLKLLFCVDDNFTDMLGVPTVTAGVTKRVFDFMHVYAGAGYSPVNVSEGWSSSYSEGWPIGNSGAAFDLGFIILPVRHMSVNLGYTLAYDFDGGYNSFVQLGVGYTF